MILLKIINPINYNFNYATTILMSMQEIDLAILAPNVNAANCIGCGIEHWCRKLHQTWHKISMVTSMPLPRLNSNSSSNANTAALNVDVTSNATNAKQLWQQCKYCSKMWYQTTMTMVITMQCWASAQVDCCFGNIIMLKRNFSIFPFCSCLLLFFFCVKSPVYWHQQDLFWRLMHHCNFAWTQLIVF